MPNLRLCIAIATAAFLSIGASVRGETGTAPAVTLLDKNDRVTLDNGIARFDIGKVNGDISELSYRSTPILAQPGYLDWVAGGNHHLGHGSFAVVADPARSQGDLAEISVTQKYAGEGPPFDVELHYVLRRGDNGPYAFVVIHHASEYPAGSIGQVRWVLRLDDKVFDSINIDDQRRREMPPGNTPAKILGPKESSMFTEGPFKGLITDKYHFFADAGDHFVHGWTGTQRHLGCWIVYGSNESQNGGPTKQHNTAHFGRMLFKIVTCGHYGSGSGLTLSAGEEWRKVYGPWMLYLNSGGDKDALWADAKKQAAAQMAAWPPAWMRQADYPPEAARGTVSGSLHIADPQDPAASPAHAWIGLAAAAPDWQKQGKGYQFWVRAAADGTFRISHVRAGEYTLYAFTPGVMDEYRQEGVKVASGGVVDLGPLTWQPLRYGRQVWQIGTPDRTAKEFRHGDDYRQWGLWNKFPEDFPTGVNFVIGRSKEGVDWNYAQVNVQQSGQWVGTTWNILFASAHSPSAGTATLRCALAAAHNAKLTVLLNGQKIGGFRTAADNAVIRAGIHGQYTEEDIAFDAARLKPGQNTISLEQDAVGNAQKSIMYDCVRLELDDSRPFDPIEAVFKKKADASPVGDSTESED